MFDIKKYLKQNSVTCFIYYICRYKIIKPVKFYAAYARVKFLPFTLKNDELEALRNTHKGEACIIVGNGPSLKLSDLDLIQKSGMDSFGANKIFDLLDKTDWCPTYLSVMAPSFIIGSDANTSPEEFASEIKKRKIRYAFLSYVLKNKIEKTRKIIFVNSYLACLFSTVTMPFSADCAKYVSDLGNVTQYSIQLAYYMGYRTIYLYGIDNTYTKILNSDGIFKNNSSIKSHADGMRTNSCDEYSDSVPKTKFQAYRIGGYSDMRKSNKGYLECKNFAAKHGLEIINLTHGGALDFFERRDFYSVFGD